MIELSEYELKLIGWTISTSKNALVLEQERDEPQLSQESSTILLRRLHKLEEKLTDYYEEKLNG